MARQAAQLLNEMTRTFIREGEGRRSPQGANKEPREPTVSRGTLLWSSLVEKLCAWYAHGMRMACAWDYMSR